MRPWPVPVRRAARFHLRHTTATLLLRAGVSPQFVQRVLRHASITTTVGTYGHLTVEDLRAAVATLPAATGGKPQALAVGADGARRLTAQVLRGGPEKHEGPKPSGNPVESSALREAGKGIRTLDPQLGKLMLYQLSYSRRTRPEV